VSTTSEFFVKASECDVYLIWVVYFANKQNRGSDELLWSVIRRMKIMCEHSSDYALA